MKAMIEINNDNVFFVARKQVYNENNFFIFIFNYKNNFF